MGTRLPEIIGIAGTNGSGKDRLASLRHELTGAHTVSLSDILRDTATERGLDHSRENLRTISAEMGHAFGAGALSLMTITRYRELHDAGTGLSIVSVRRPYEAATIKEHGGAVIWMDADRDARYARIKDGNRGRSEDIAGYEEFCQQEDIELYGPADDPTAVNMAGVREIADVHVDNTHVRFEDSRAFLIKTFSL